MKSVKLITWNEQEQRYEMSLGSLGVSRPEEFGGGKFNILISRDTVEDQLVMNISDDRLADGTIITINSDQNEGEANVTINAVSHFSDTVNIRHAIDFLDQNNNGYYYQKARLSADNVPNLALFEIGTEYNSPTYTLKAVNGPLDEGGMLYIPCKTRMTQHVTFTNGMQIACDATVNGTVNFNATVHFNSAANFNTLTIGSQTLDEGTIINLLNSSSSGGSSIDLSRFVSAHSAISSTSGEEQSIYGGKTFKDETVFEDNVVLDIGAVVNNGREIKPDTDETCSIGNSSYKFADVYTKKVHAAQTITDTIKRASSGSIDNYSIPVECDIVPSLLFFRHGGSRKSTIGTASSRWNVYADTLDVSDITCNMDITCSRMITTLTLNATASLSAPDIASEHITSRDIRAVHAVLSENGQCTQALHLISGCLITTEPCVESDSEYTGRAANDLLFFASSANGGQATYSGVGSGTLCELTLASLNGQYHTIDLRTLSEVENYDTVSPLRVTVARGGLVLAMFPQALFHSFVQSDAPVTIPVGYCFTLENASDPTDNENVWYPAQLTFDKSSNTTVYVEDTRHQIQAGTYRLMSSVKIPQGPVSMATTLTLPVFLQRTN